MSSPVVRSGAEVVPLEERLLSVDETRSTYGKRMATALQARYGSQMDEARACAHEEGLAAGREQGYSEGWTLGLAKAEELAAERRAEQESEFTSFLELERQRIDTAFETWKQETEDRIAEVALAIAGEVLRRELETSQEATLDLVRAAMRDVMHGVSLRIRVPVRDAQFALSQREVLLSERPGTSSVEIVPDESITAGCVVETEGGVVDARIDTVLNRLLAAYREAA